MRKENKKQVSLEQWQDDLGRLDVEKLYLTTNLYEASFLIAHDFKVLSFRKADNKKVAVLFENTPRLRKYSSKYFNGGVVSAVKFTDAYRRLKDSVFGAQHPSVS